MHNQITSLHAAMTIPLHIEDRWRGAGTNSCREGRLLDLSYPTKGRQCEAPLAGHDDGRRHHQWLPLSSHARARRPKKPLAQSEPEDARSCGRRRRRRRHAGDRAVGRGTGTQGAGRSAEGSRGRPESAGVVRLARVGSTMPARCSLPGSDAFAASIGLGSIVKASALLKRRFR